MSMRKNSHTGKSARRVPKGSQAGRHFIASLWICRHEVNVW